MTKTQNLLIAGYALIAVVALVLTWGQNVAYFSGDAGVSAFWAFVIDTKANPASRSITVDVGFFLLAACAFMVIEARRLGVGFVWLYVLLAFLVAASVAFPLFLIARELRLAPANKPDTPWSLTMSDVVGLALVAALVLALSWFVLH
jgi:hypothetical protein